MRGGSFRQLSHGRLARADLSGVLLDEQAARRPLDLPAVFGNPRPVEVEIGSGKGTFLLARAAARPELNFLGVEWARAYCHYAADRIRRAGLTNARMIRADAAVLFRRAIPPGALLRLHIYFPDPWPKRKHRRRRLIQPSFIRLARRSLRPGGQLLIVTDHREYFEQIRAVLSVAAGLVPIDMPRMSNEDGTLVGTNFEKKYIAQGRAFYRIAALRYEPPAGLRRFFPTF